MRALGLSAVRLARHARQSRRSQTRAPNTTIDGPGQVTELPFGKAQVERIVADLNAIAEYRDPTEPGWTRRALGEPYGESRHWVRSRMKAAGLEVSVDGAGNILGRLPGQGGRSAALVTGSHTDSVVGGGRYDGICGVLGAIEAVRCIHESGVRLDHDLVVVDFFGEETNDYGFGCLGSRAAAEGLSPDILNSSAPDGGLLAERLNANGIVPGQLVDPLWKPGSVAAFIELHVEQGPTLAERGLPIGVVTAITGIERLVARFAGRADHAGTRRMQDRRDAMVAAARSVLAVERVGCEAPVQGVATTTRVDNPNPSPNVVPARIIMQSEIRSVDASWLVGARGRISEEILHAAQAGGVEVEVDWSTDNRVVPADLLVQEAIAAGLDRRGIPWMPIPSGATHDAVHMAALAPAGMIFIPSQNDGISHSPDELTEPADIAMGVDVLVDSLIRLDSRLA